MHVAGSGRHFNYTFTCYQSNCYMCLLYCLNCFSVVLRYFSAMNLGRTCIIVSYELIVKYHGYISAQSATSSTCYRKQSYTLSCPACPHINMWWFYWFSWKSCLRWGGIEGNWTALVSYDLERNVVDVPLYLQTLCACFETTLLRWRAQTTG